MDATTPAEYQAILDAACRELRSRRGTPRFVLGPRRLARRLASGATALHDRLAVITPPSDVADEHVALLRGLQRAASDLTTLANRADLKMFERFNALADMDMATAELSALRSKGYRWAE